MSNAASWQTVPNLLNKEGKFETNFLPKNKTIENLDDTCSKISENEIVFSPLINGFCYLIKQEVIQKIGYLDEENFPIGYGEEDDFSLRALNAGFIHIITTNAYVFHAKSKSFSPEGRLPLAKKGGEMLRLKHGSKKIEESVAYLRENKQLK